MANKRPRDFPPGTLVTDDVDIYYQPPTGSEVKFNMTQLVNYLNGKILDKSHTHNQANPATVWNIVHNFGRQPAGVLARNASGQEIQGELQVVDDNSLNILFNQAVSGTAYLS